MSNYTLRRRLFRQLGWPLIVILILGGIFAYFFALHAAMTAYDLGLLNDALDLAQQVEIRNGRLSIDLPLAAQQMLQANNQDRESYATWDEDGNLFSGNPKLLRLHDQQTTADHRFDDLVLNGEMNRAVILRQRMQDKTYYIAVSQTMRGRNLLTDRTFAEILFPETLLAFVSIGIILWGVRRGLTPVETLRDEIVSRSSTDLRPIEEASAPAELSPIIHGINELFDRLTSSFASHRRFIADAAHQLRTPLASLSSQIEVGLQKTPDDMEKFLHQLLATTHRTTHLSNQLLSLARLEHTETAMHEVVTIDLRHIFLETSADFVSLAARKGVEIDFDLQPSIVRGSPLMLRELVSNLLDNAVRYTPAGGKVEVRLRNESDENILLTMQNDGPPISNQELKKLGTPFHRTPSSDPDGCGLGLAIVKEIARIHGAKVTFDHSVNGAGLKVRALFQSFVKM